MFTSFKDCSTEQIAIVYRLRNETAKGIKHCFDALKEAEWDYDKAHAIVLKKGSTILYENSSAQ